MIIGGPVKSLDGALPFHRCVPGLIPGVCRQDGSDCQIGQGGVLRVWYACGFFHQYRIHILPKEGAYRQCTSARCVLCESLYPIHVWYVCKYSWILSGKQKKNVTIVSIIYVCLVWRIRSCVGILDTTCLYGSLLHPLHTQNEYHNEIFALKYVF